MTQELSAEQKQRETSLPRFRGPAVDHQGRSGIFGVPTFLAGPDPVRLPVGLGALRRRRIPYFPQLTAADCGPTCLRMVLASRGVNAPAQQLRQESNAGRNGVSASRLLAVGRRYGLDGRGVRTDLSGLVHLTSGAILFWRFNHFVVLEKANRSHIVIVDPAVGRRVISWKEVDANFTGVALEFAHEVGVTDTPQGAADSGESIEFAKSFVPRTSKWLWIFAVSICLLLYALAFPLMIRYLVTEGADDVGSSTSMHAGWVGALILAVASFGLLQYGRSRLIVAIQGLLEARAGHLLMGRISRLPLDFFLARHPGDLAQRVRSAARLRQVVSVTTVGAIFDAMMVIGYVLTIGIRELKLALIVVFCIAWFVAVIAFSWRRQRQLSSDALEARTKSASELHEMLANVTSVKALGAESAMHTRWLNSFSDELTTGTRQRRHAGVVTSFVATLQFAAPLAVLIAGVVFSIQARADLSAAVLLSALCTGLFASLSNLSVASTAFVEVIPDLYRMNDILVSDTERSGTRTLQLATRPPKIRLEGVSYTYVGGSTETVKNIAAEVPSGGVLAIIGPSGCGKSTLGMLIGGLIDPTSGRIAVDGVDLSEVNLAEFRKSIGYVDQNSSLISGSIFDNIRLGCPGASFEEVRRAAQVAEVDDFVMSLPMKYETILGVGGTGISGGQRQRVVLARALVKKPAVLILDEATSAIDPDTEDSIFRKIRDQNATIVVLGHRAALTKGASGVLSMLNGEGDFVNRAGNE
ncbi:peptidase domain-containing ABC transporter [Nocardia carnea]|uniref:peptidase domain-containing ABC transporter n=1 Tax=Nocardia carnea TaxID=37328 RepID=UPI00245838EC|nr:peptidase domain-containing ABC transporter [Nocardia carnea]